VGEEKRWTGVKYCTDGEMNKALINARSGRGNENEMNATDLSGFIS
jgi:hypothetical protein